MTAIEYKKHNLLAKVFCYRLAREALDCQKNIELPPRTPVRVDSARYKGCGVVVGNQEAPDQLAVLLENNSVWWYPIEDCRPITWPETAHSTRRAWLRRNGYSLNAQFGPRRPLP